MKKKIKRRKRKKKKKTGSEFEKHKKIVDTNLYLYDFTIQKLFFFHRVFFFFFFFFFFFVWRAVSFFLSFIFVVSFGITPPFSILGWRIEVIERGGKRAAL